MNKYHEEQTDSIIKKRPQNKNLDYFQQSKSCQSKIIDKINYIFGFIIIFVVLIFLKFCRLPPGVEKQRPVNTQVTAVFITCCGRQNYLPQTLKSFFKLNDYPIYQAIIVLDGQVDANFLKTLQEFDNLTILATGSKEGQLRSIDEVLLLVETTYVYYSQDDWKTKQVGLINQSISKLQKQPKLLQLWNAQVGMKLLQDRIVDPQSIWGGFSLIPSVWRMKDIDKLPQGKFSVASRDFSYASGAGLAQLAVIIRFKKLRYYVKSADKLYLDHIGNQIRTDKQENYWKLFGF